MARRLLAKPALRRAGSIKASAKMPCDVRTMLKSPGRVRAGEEEIIQSHRVPDSGEIVLDGFRPDWVNAQFMPEVRRFRTALFRAIASEGPGSFRVRRASARHVRRAPVMRPLVQEALTHTWPWSTIGRVEYFVGGQLRGWGTGTLVGQSTVITASHLVPWGQGWAMTFSPGYRDGDGDAGRANVTLARGWKDWGSDPSGFDLAILRLDRPLGQALGFMGSQSFGDWDDYTDRTWISVGYPAVDNMTGTRPIVDFDIDIVDLDGDDGFEIETDYGRAFGGGWSGGPMWGLIGSGGVIGGDPRVIGVRSGYEADGWDPVRGVFAGGDRLVDLIRFGRTNWG